MYNNIINEDEFEIDELECDCGEDDCLICSSVEEEEDCENCPDSGG